jgi:hypothetical protein
MADEAGLVENEGADLKAVRGVRGNDKLADGTKRHRCSSYSGFGD